MSNQITKEEFNESLKEIGMDTDSVKVIHEFIKLLIRTKDKSILKLLLSEVLID